MGLMHRSVILTVALLLGACSTSSPPAGERGPGTELGDGFTVPGGAELLGIFPLEPSGDLEPGASWTADLRITGSILAVQDELKRQALDQDMELGAGCSTSPEVTSCSFGARRVEDGVMREAVDVELQQTPTLERGYASHGSITYARWGPGEGPEPPTGLGGMTPLDEVPPAVAPPDVPTVGDPLAEDQVTEGNPRIVVAEGSEVIAPVRTYSDCTGGFDAHLVVTGEPDEVVGDYQRQLDRWTNFRDGRPPTTPVFRGHEALHDSRYASGGGDLTLDVVFGDQEATYLRISRCGD
jgi:hypothetical protein